MGSDVSKNRKEGPAAPRRFSHGFLSTTVVSIAHRFGHSAVFPRPTGPDDRLPAPRLVLPPEDNSGTSDTERTPPAFISVFLPEFPRRKFPGQDSFQIMGLIAKGSYGPIIKVKDIFNEKTYAVKVLPKSEILKHGVLEQSKEEVIIQHPDRTIPVIIIGTLVFLPGFYHLRIAYYAAKGYRGYSYDDIPDFGD